MDTTAPELLTRSEINLLREARVTLVKLGIRCSGGFTASEDTLAAFSLGRLAEAAEMAESAVFNALTSALHYGDVAAIEPTLNGVYEDARQ